MHLQHIGRVGTTADSFKFSRPFRRHSNWHYNGRKKFHNNRTYLTELEAVLINGI